MRALSPGDMASRVAATGVHSNGDAGAQPAFHSQNARASLTELGRCVGLTPAAVGHRLRRL